MAGLLDNPKRRNKGLLDVEEAPGLLGRIARTVRQEYAGKTPQQAIADVPASMYANPLVNAAIGFTPVVGDIQSGVEALRSAAGGRWGEAALNGVGVLPFLPAMAGMFIGKGAKTWDALAAAKAADMEKAGADARAIWKETGTFKGPDGHWRQEIPDNAAFRPRYGLPDGREYGAFDEVLNHPNLKKAYPENADILTGVSVSPNVEGAFSPAVAGNKYEYGRQAEINASGPSRPSLKSTLIHEQQHAIQEREGWAKGGSPKEFVQDLMSEKNIALREIDAINRRLRAAVGTPEYQDLLDMRSKLVKKANIDDVDLVEKGMREYKRLAGEAEARATQARMNMDAAQRRATFPLDSYDVPVDQLIIRGLLL